MGAVAKRLILGQPARTNIKGELGALRDFIREIAFMPDHP
jgi:hypothetical protein